ncbi:MAG: hypothetical protein COV46_03755 [Deltaproteobacteria bacterium CG11_big_fil_rev_8_21_14_0_20_49_13]|nr:MAG: hypothetical protein COV46_03755 [Deltaproteobacteria bacterium CG11_big_fil_rev_8_21_14_0_20_49_13]
MNAKELNKAMEYFKKTPSVLFACLFGSHAKGGANRLSDIDIAVYMSANVSHSDLYKHSLKFMADCPLKGTKDVVMLNESSPLLAYEVLAHGRPIFIRDKKVFIDFTVAAYSRYFDTKKIRQIQFDALSERIKGGKIGHFKGNCSYKVAKIRAFACQIARTRKTH